VGSVWPLLRNREGLDADGRCADENRSARAALRRPTDVDDFVFANSGSGRTVRPMVRSPPSCGGTLRFDTTPIDTALRPVSARTTGCKNDPKLGKKRTPPVSK